MRTAVNVVLACLMVRIAMLARLLPVDLCRPQLRAGLFQRILPIIIVLAGIVVPASTLPPRTAFAFWMNLHPVFGLLLLVFVASSFYWHLNVPAPLRRSDIRQFSRRLGRNVYLLLYLVIFIKKMIELIRAAWQDGFLDMGLLKDYLQMPADRVGDAFRQDFQGYIAAGVLAIIVVRVFTATYLRLANNSAAP